MEINGQRIPTLYDCLMVGGAREKSFITVKRKNSKSPTPEGLKYTSVGLAQKDSNYSLEILIMTREQYPNGDSLSERSEDILVCPILEKAGYFYLPQNPV